MTRPTLKDGDLIVIVEWPDGEITIDETIFDHFGTAAEEWESHVKDGSRATVMQMTGGMLVDVTEKAQDLCRSKYGPIPQHLWTDEEADDYAVRDYLDRSRGGSGAWV